MKWLHKLRASSYFVDVLLLIAAVFAMAGLATFVRLHATKAPDEAGKKSTIATNSMRAEIMQTSPEASNPNTSNSSAPQLQAAMSAPENASAALRCGQSCDDMKISPSDKNDAYDELKNPAPTKNCGGYIERTAQTTLRSDFETPLCQQN